MNEDYSHLDKFVSGETEYITENKIPNEIDLDIIGKKYNLKQQETPKLEILIGIAPPYSYQSRQFIEAKMTSTTMHNISRIPRLRVCR